MYLSFSTSLLLQTCRICKVFGQIRTLCSRAKCHQHHQRRCTHHHRVRKGRRWWRRPHRKKCKPKPRADRTRTSTSPSAKRTCERGDDVDYDDGNDEEDVDDSEDVDYNDEDDHTAKNNHFLLNCDNRRRSLNVLSCTSL